MPRIDLSWTTLQRRPDILRLQNEFCHRLGGERAFLKHLWKFSAMAFPGPQMHRSKPLERKRWLKIQKLSGELLKQSQQIDLDELPLPLRILAITQFQNQNRMAVLSDMAKGAETIIGTLKDSLGWTRHKSREFWCAALVPYFDFKRSSGDRWNWIIQWMDAIGAEENLPCSDSVRDWWARRVLPATSRAFVDSRGKRKVDPETGWPATDVDDRLEVIFLAALDYTGWRWPKNTESDIPERKRYVAVVRKRIPALKYVVSPDYYSSGHLPDRPD